MSRQVSKRSAGSSQRQGKQNSGGIDNNSNSHREAGGGRGGQGSNKHGSRVVLDVGTGADDAAGGGGGGRRAIGRILEKAQIDQGLGTKGRRGSAFAPSSSEIHGILMRGEQDRAA